MNHQYNIEVSVHKKLDKGGYRVKVEILNEDILMYINGTRVFPPNDEKDWSVQTPGIPNSKDKTVSFDGKSPLWKEYKQACIEAVQEYIRLEKLDNPIGEDIYEKSEEDFNKQMIEDMEKLGF